MSNMSSMKIGKISRTLAQKFVTFLKRSSHKYVVEMVFCVLMAIMVFFVAFPAIVNADQDASRQTAGEKTVALTIEAMQNETRPYGTLPEAKIAHPHETVNVPVTAYSSEVGQTDSTPFITASGSRVRDGIVAANFLPIGTKVRFPELYGSKIFVVEDRMNKRYWHRMDIWMADTQDAKNFGIKRTRVEIYHVR